MKVEKMYFHSRRAAKHVFNVMRDLIDEYGYLRIAHYYDICGSCGPFRDTDMIFGWRDINGAKIIADRHWDYTNYYLEMPDAIKLCEL